VVAAGYRRVLIDPEGYRRGRLNEALRVVSVT
jgi:PP-loop superfamily ATP-utilizing enzyme